MPGRTRPPCPTGSGWCNGAQSGKAGGCFTSTTKRDMRNLYVSPRSSVGLEGSAAIGRADGPPDGGSRRLDRGTFGNAEIVVGQGNTCRNDQVLQSDFAVVHC